MEETSIAQFQAEPLFFNQIFKIGRQYIYVEYLDWSQAGISTVADILLHNGSFREKTT